jgi:RimJ/RimL family protein N-acetyltransferase
MKPVLETKRLLLRPHRHDDAERIVRFIGDFDVAGNLARVPYPYTPKDAGMWLDSQAERPDPAPDATAFAIDIKGEGYVGTVGIHQGDSGEPVLGYWLGKPWWGRGYMTEAAGTVRDWYFAATNSERLLCGAFHFNAASLAIQRKLGFVETGRSRIYCLARGEDIDHIDTALTRTSFMELKAVGGENR